MKGKPKDQMRVVQIILRKSDIAALRRESAAYLGVFLAKMPENHAETCERIREMLIDRWNLGTPYSGRDQHYSFTTKGKG